MSRRGLRGVARVRYDPVMVRCQKLPDRLVAVELNHGEGVDLTRRDGTMCRLVVRETSAWVTDTTLPLPLQETRGAVTNYRFHAVLEVDGCPIHIERVVASQESFYEPATVAGLVIYLDAVNAIFDFLHETHGPCRPRAACRLAIHDASCRLCPQPVHPFCPLPEGGLRIEQCYNGEDCWLGAYYGAAAHGGLDINHPAGTPIFAPLDIHDHYLFDAVSRGANNNRWRGVHRWPDGGEWHVQCHHLISLSVDEHTFLRAGQTIASGAGVWIGDHPHSHFAFRIRDVDEDGQVSESTLDPWILFRQMYADLPLTTAGNPSAVLGPGTAPASEARMW